MQILTIITDPQSFLTYNKGVFQRNQDIPFNWGKSEATLFSSKRFSCMVENFQFKWVHKGIKYLGIKLSAELEELLHLHFNPVLLKMKTNLEKMGRVKKCHSGGKIKTIKMVIASHFHYVIMILPITIPSTIFKPYENVIHFLGWKKSLSKTKQIVCTESESWPRTA